MIRSQDAGPATLVRSRVREVLLRELAQDRQEVRASLETRATCLVGAPDLGKGWVVARALEDAEGEGFETLVARASPDESSAPLSFLRAALGSWRGASGPEAGSRPSEGDPGPEEGGPAPEGILGISSLVLGAALPADPSPVPSPSGPSARAEYRRLVSSLTDPNQTAMEKRARLLTQVRSFLAEQAKLAPLVLALEDVHLADQVSADFVAVLLEWRTNAPLWVLLTYTEEEDLYPPLRRALERTFLSRVVVRRPVARLSVGEVRLFLLEAWSSKAPLPGAVLDEIVRRADGLPGVALRLAQHYQAHGTLPGEAGGAPVEVTADPLAHLREDQERVLALAAVAGSTAGFELLRRAAGEEEEKMAELLEDLVQRGVLLERPGARYEFAEEALRLRLYRGLTQARRRVLHRKVAMALEGLPGVPDASRVVALAHHFTEAKVDEKAMVYLEQALELARGAGSLQHEQERLRQLLAVHARSRPKDARGEASLLHQLGSISYALGSDDEAAQTLARARDLLRNLHETGPAYAAVLLDLGRVTSRRGDAAVAESLSTEALARFQEAHDLLGVATVQRFRSRLAYAGGQYEATRQGLLACLEALRAGQGPPAEIGRTLTALADAEFMLDHADRPAATARLEEGIRLLQEAGDQAGALFAILGRASIESALHDEDASRASMERAVALLPETPEAWRLEEAMLRKGANHVAKGEFQEALGHARVAADLARRMGDREREARALLFSADTAGRSGDLARATQFAEGALRLGRELQHARTQAEALLRLAAGEAKRGDAEGARRRLAEVDALGKGLEVSRSAQALRRDVREMLERAES